MALVTLTLSGLTLLAFYSRGETGAGTSSVDRMAAGQERSPRVSSYISSFKASLLSLNKAILWKPASAAADPVTRFGDELRAVFGPIPDGDCTGPSSRRIGLEVEGNSVELRHNPAKAGSPLEFAHFDASGALTKWTGSIPRCDKPSLAGGVTFCGINSRISYVRNDHVEWLFLCRKSSDDLEIHADAYWTETDPRFSRYSAIGFNDLTGEIAFVDGRKDRSVFDWSRPLPPPGGKSYADRAGRSQAEGLYDGTFRINCAACHDNKKPAIIDPYMQQRPIGYSAREERATAENTAAGRFLPIRKAKPDAPFRVIGSDFTALHGAAMGRQKAVSVEGHACSECHSLTTSQTGKRFAADAVAMAPSLDHPTTAQTAAMLSEQAELRLLRDHRTTWASAGGPGGIMPWMMPDHGGRLAAGQRSLSNAKWKELTACIWGNGDKDCGYRPLFTDCPAPGSSNDTNIPSDVSISADPLHNDRLRLTWRYLNGLGKVPQRDDVRFNVAIKVEEMRQSKAPHEPPDYPSMDDARGAGPLPETTVLLENASFSGHFANTDPAPSTGPRTYSIEIPASCGKRYLARILPKRFCFDDENVAYGAGDFVVHYNNLCGG